MHSESDILIIGGGLVGASLACALGQAGLRITIVEACPFSDDQQAGGSGYLFAGCHGAN